MQMGILALIILGAIVGIVAEHLTGERTGALVAIAVGILGALLGGWLASNLLHHNTLRGFFDISTWITAIIGAVVLLLIVRALSVGTRRRGRRRVL